MANHIQCLLDASLFRHYFITKGMKVSSLFEYAVIIADGMKSFPVTILLHLWHVLAFGLGMLRGPHGSVWREVIRAETARIIGNRCKTQRRRLRTPVRLPNTIKMSEQVDS